MNKASNSEIGSKDDNFCQYRQCTTQDSHQQKEEKEKGGKGTKKKRNSNNLA